MIFGLKIYAGVKILDLILILNMTSKKVFMDLQETTLKMLKDNLPPELSYHNYEHTLDVVAATERIARAENVSEEDFQLLRTAAVFHDTGYIHTREKHEEKSCEIATQIMTEFSFAQSEIDKVCNLILATRMPHNPSDKLSQIICDADLDYLGRDDYFPIAKNVFREFKHFGIVNSDQDWILMQERFFETHKYFTKTSIETRNKKKAEHLQEIKEQKKLKSKS